MALFEVPKRPDKSHDLMLAKKSSKRTTPQPVIKSGNGVLGRVEEIKAMVTKSLGQYKDDYICITEKEVLHDYITECIGNGYISIDTETDGLDPLQNKLAGICPYTRGQKGAYIPINHISHITGVQAPGQLDLDFIISEFKRLLAKKPDIDMFNAKFDIRFLRANGLSDIYCTWDGFLASRLLNENEPHKNLKQLHQKYCLNGQGDAFRFDDLFKGIPFTMIPYNVGYLYAAHDPVITTELCDYQRPFLTPGTAECTEYELDGVSWVFHNIEMPCIQVVADMEDNGVLFDTEYGQKLSDVYNKELSKKESEFYKLCSKYDAEIAQYRIKHGTNCKLSDPISISSPAQISILLYDIMKIDTPDPKNPRGTGVDILMKVKDPIAKKILEYREVQKLLSTYIDKLPTCVNPKDGRIHCSFNQYGADTGRFSSSDPNLQNIPSHNKDIRKMFVASRSEDIITTETFQFEVDRWCEVECVSGWKYADRLVAGDSIKDINNDILTVRQIQIFPSKVIIDYT